MALAVNLGWCYQVRLVLDKRYTEKCKYLLRPEISTNSAFSLVYYLRVPPFCASMFTLRIQCFDFILVSDMQN